LRVLDAFREGATPLRAPEVIVAEFGHTLRKLVVRRELSPDDSRTLLDDFLALDLELIPIQPLATEALRLSTSHMSTFYDALYMSLAVREGIELLTADERAARAFATLGRVKLLGDWQR
jgi:predicted nucleic acid-binding protein